MAGSVESESSEGDFGFQIAPMVDVVFVLMLFFMASAGMQVVEKELGINLPSGGTRVAQGPPPIPIIIEIKPDGQVTMDNKAYAATDKHLNDLREWFKNEINTFGDKDTVIIRPSPDTRHERVMDVLNAAAASGVKKLTFG